MRPKHVLVYVFVMVCLITSACAPAQPGATSAPEKDISPTSSSSTIPTEPIASGTASTSAGKSGSGSVLIRLRLVTTSDWTNLFLVSGATWGKTKLISVDATATGADVQGNQLILNQPFSRAEAGERSEMVIEALLTTQTDKTSVLFKIERGNIGLTQAEFSSFIGNEWTIVKTITWDGVTGDGTNAHIIEIPARDLIGEAAVANNPPKEPVQTSVVSTAGLPQGTDGYPWWNDSVCYEIFVRSFYDSNYDGIGDINGITQKLDYLNDGNPDTATDLGISCLWLMPIYPSPSYHGYNVTDFYTVNPEYGTLDDFLNLVHAAHSRGIRIILDLTLNHTSTQHPWFIEAQDPGSPYHDWYIWSDFDPGYTGSWGQQVWFPFEERFYYSTFSVSFADLNYKNPAVVAEMEKVVRFWLEEVGVDGFRLDAAKHIIEEGPLQANSASTHAWWKSFRTFYKQINPQAFTVAEIWDTPKLNAQYVQGDELDLSLDFALAANFLYSVRAGSAISSTNQIEISYASVPPIQMAIFLTNHDQVRLMDQLGFDPQKVKVAASLLLTAPGMPFIYYGEEIGMQGQKPDEQKRAPMQWSTDANAGFSMVSPWEPLGPGWQSYNVSTETADPASMLSHYRNLIQARNQHAALRVGDLSVLATQNNGLYSILRVSQEETVLVMINLTGAPVTNYSLSIEQSKLAEGSRTASAILGSGEFTSLVVNSTGGFSQYIPISEIPPYSTFIIQLR